MAARRQMSILVTLWLCASATAALSQQAVPLESVQQPSLTVHNYGDIDKACLRWTDTCRVCDRIGGCGNIGIACQPGHVRCTERQAVEPNGHPNPDGTKR